MFRADAEGIAELAAALLRIDGVFEAKLAEIEGRVGDNAQTWTGEAATAYAALHAAWQAGAAEMRAGATALHLAADAAHGNYTSANSGQHLDVAPLMGVIAIDPSQIADASFYFAEASTQAARTVTRAFSTLDVVSLSMAGSDAGGMSWATAYDRAVTEVETASAAVVNALGQMSVLLDATGANHANADAASVPGGRDPDYSGTATPVTGYGVCGPPSASGGSTNPPDGWHWIADLMEYTWPNGHQDRLHQAGAAWQAAASSITALTEPLTSEAAYLIEEQQSPEIPAITGYITSVTTQTNDLAAAYTSLGSACDTYATHLDTAHSNIISQVKSFVEWTAGLEIVGGLLTIVTVGASDVAANGAVAVKAAAVAARVGGIIGDLIETIGDVVQTIVNVTARIIEITKNLRLLLSLKVAAATTRVVGAMPGIEAFTALATRLRSGKALAEVVDGGDTAANEIIVDSGKVGDWSDALNGPLEPNSTYIVDGKYTYVTDADGNVVGAKTKLDTLDPGKDRSKYQQSKVAKGTPGDVGGHIFARIFGGPGEAINLTSQAGGVNGKLMGALERTWENAIKDGKTVDVETTITRGADGRPLTYEYDYTIEGQSPVTVVFQNK